MILPLRGAPEITQFWLAPCLLFLLHVSFYSAQFRKWLDRAWSELGLPTIDDILVSQLTPHLDRVTGGLLTTPSTTAADAGNDDNANMNTPLSKQLGLAVPNPLKLNLGCVCVADISFS